MVRIRSVLAKAFREVAIDGGLMLDTGNFQELAKSKPTVRFGWYIGETGDVFAQYDLFNLVRLILLGENFKDAHGHGDHLIMLQNYAWASDVATLLAGDAITDNFLYWNVGYDRKDRPRISFEEFLVSEVDKHAKSLNEKLLRMRLLAMLKKWHEK